MNQPLKLNDILADLKEIGNDGIEKQASEKKEEQQKEASPADIKQELIKSLNEAMQPSQEKKAEQNTSATDQLVKIASELADSERVAIIKEAEVYGAAMADSFVARLQQWENASEKVASDNSDTYESFEKFAEENPDLTKQAVELGYLTGMQEIEQAKTAAFVQGYKDANAEIAELMKTEEGQNKLAEIAEGLEKQAAENETLNETLEKIAADPEARKSLEAGYKEASESIVAGYRDTAKELNKLAQDTFSRGYNDTIKILKAL